MILIDAATPLRGLYAATADRRRCARRSRSTARAVSATADAYTSSATRAVYPRRLWDFNESLRYSSACSIAFVVIVVDLLLLYRLRSSQR
jgi:hypothetical protein